MLQWGSMHASLLVERRCSVLAALFSEEEDSKEEEEEE
jgi:hypothetical protein